MELAVALSRSVVAEDVECAVSRGMLEREIADVDASIAKLQSSRSGMSLPSLPTSSLRPGESSAAEPSPIKHMEMMAAASLTMAWHRLVVPSLAPFFAQLNHAAESAPFEVQMTFPAWKENLTFLASCSVASVEAAHARLRAEMTKLKEAAATDDPNAANMAVVYKALEYFDQHMQSTILHKARQNDVGGGAATVMTTGDDAVPVLR
ncbi:hypothetical protein DYB30_004110 [Aphanomyces astaci]|nr:hypothetical protein DYB30_004110 [Aphanomyces astaci]